jgi:DNA-binding GntR family transcriptional regulator
MESSNQKRLHLQIYIDIVSKIVLGAFPKGHHLIEEDLAKTYGASRTPVRDALFALEKDGLIERTINRGAIITSFTPDDVEQIYEIRKSLECLAIRGANRNLKLSDLLQFEGRLEALSDCDPVKFSQAHADIDIELHQFIISHSHNRWLSIHMERISLLTHALRSMGYNILEHAHLRNNEHLGIVRALLRRDAELAEKLLDDHIERSKKIALEFFFENRFQRHVLAPVAAQQDRGEHRPRRKAAG